MAGTMPTLRVGQVWEDMDPRCAGRTLLIETLAANGTVTSRTLTPRKVTARTPAGYRLQTVGRTQTIAASRFRPGSRGFRLTGALIQLRPDGSVVNADTVTATLGEVAPKSTTPPVTTKAAAPPPSAALTKAIKTIKTIKAAGSPASAVVAPAVATVASLLRENPTEVDQRVAETLCALLGTQGAAKWLASAKTSWVIKDYRAFGDTQNLLCAAVRVAGKQGLLGAFPAYV